jgi:Na+/H+ antiporter NhaD/arsenite permease-like protein
MLIAIIVVFVLGYLLIALEHQVHIDKAASALLIGVLCWTLYMLDVQSLVTDSGKNSIPSWFNEFMGAKEAGDGDQASAQVRKQEWLVEGQLNHGIGEIAGILFFLMGAMTIVELVDAFEGFRLITKRINTNNLKSLLWLVSWLTFFLSAVLDNLTTTIVMISLLKKLIRDHDKRLFFAGMVVIAANAGGAWTVIGDVTTTMLWIKHKISTVQVMLWLFLPSVACLLVPLLVLSRKFDEPLVRPEESEETSEKRIKPYQSMLFLILGLGGLLFVPIFKTYTHLPPFMGMLLSLSVIWIASELVKHDLDQETRSSTHVLSILKKIDTGSILFFLGILLAIGALGATGLLSDLAARLDRLTGGNLQLVAIVIGLVSAVVDNVPLVAAGIEMYQMPTDDPFWHLLAYCAGTGGSCLVIGSAAGVAAMGLEKINFLWYVRRISIWALLGYFAGIAIYMIQYAVFG